jgi:outer membrane protein TolC
MSIRDVVLSVCIWLMMTSPAFAQEEVVALKFDDLAEFAASQSSTMQVIERAYDLAKTEREINLKWTNPELNYSQEDAGGQMEQYVTLSKQIEMPWVYSSRKRSWNAQLESEKFKKEDRVRHTLSNLKSGYIELKLLGTQLETLKWIKDIVMNASDVSHDQLKEGFLSGVDQHLIQMALVNINAKLQEINLTARLRESEWKADMGIDASSNIQLLTDVHYKPLELDSLDYYLPSILNTPGYRQREMIKTAIQNKIQMERRRLIPYFSLFGGSKILQSDQDGYVVGISIPLPLSSQNRLAVQEQRIELENATAELERYQQILQGQVKMLLPTIQALGASLEMAETQLSKNKDMMGSIQTSYQEGWMTLTEMLNAIELHADGIQAFYKQLTDYYRSLFQLEAIIGKTLVNFSPQKGAAK